MSRCVPSWDLEDVNPNPNTNPDAFRLDCEVAELTWENGQLAMHELGPRRLPSWVKPGGAETLEAIVNQATHQPYCKTQDQDDLVPWISAASITSDALVPSSNNKTDAGSSTRVGSCSVDRSPSPSPREDWNSLSEDGRRLTSTSTSSGKSTSPADSVSSQPEVNVIKDKKKVKVKCSPTNKRRRTAAIHNQSERKRRDKINQRMKTLQKLVPNANKTDKASMLDEVIEHVKQLQAHIHMMSRMNMSSMMMPLAMQQQHMQMSMMNMNSMGMGLGLGMGFHPSSFMQMPSWNNTSDPMSAFVSQVPMNMDAYSRMATLYQHMQNPLSKN